MKILSHLLGTWFIFILMIITIELMQQASSPLTFERASLLVILFAIAQISWKRTD